MIHALELPRQNRAFLGDIVHMQMGLLAFATSENFAPLLKEARSKKEAGKKGPFAALQQACQTYFDESQESALRGRGKAIADWFWEGRSSTRHENLEAFAEACSFVRDEAREWCKQLYEEVKALLDPEQRTVSFGHHFSVESNMSQKEDLVEWKNCASNFLLFFYKTYLGSSEGKLPASLFSQTDEQSMDGYGREEFLEYFRQANTDLEMCPCCDEHRLYSRHKMTIRTDIDHFLPKTTYPHLACHPDNLVPVCHQCNSGFKGEIDPLKNRLLLSRDLFPYGKIRLRHYGRLKIQNHDSADPTRPGVLNQHLCIVQHKYAPIEDGEETPERQKFREEELKAAISLAQELYQIPERWNTMRKMSLTLTGEAEDEQAGQALATMLMSETLVRRICQFLGHHERFFGVDERVEGAQTSLRGSNHAEVIFNDLKRLLYYLSVEDQGKDPFAFAMTWILAGKLKEEVQPAIKSGESALVGEIVSWYTENASVFWQRDQEIERLFKLLEE